MNAATRDRLRGAIVIAAIALLAAGACAVQGRDRPPTTVFESAPCPTPNIPGMPQFDLGPEYSCGFLTVPENRSRPGNRTIKLAVARVKATSPNPKPDPLVYLAGGPGGTGLATAPYLVMHGINRDRDVVFVDQRGTLHSDPKLTCPEIDAFKLEATGMPVAAASTGTKDLDAVRTCRTRLADAGYDLSAYNTTENAADIAELRTALNIGEWNVHGTSYGSDLALQLLRDHPAGIRSVVLESVLPPQTNVATQFWPSAAQGYRALFDACTAQPACASAYPDLPREFTTAVRQLAKQPLTVEVPGTDGQPPRRVVVDGFALANLVAEASLAPGRAATLPATIHSVARGDGSAAARDMIANLTPPAILGYGLTYGVFCRESVSFTDPASALSAARKALPDFPDEVLSFVPQGPRLFDECGVWDVGHADNTVHQPARSDVPVLLITGTLDAVTPPSQADEAAKTLPRGRVVRFPGLGHDVFAVSECAQRVMLDFLNRPDGYDTGCTETMQPAPFDR